MSKTSKSFRARRGCFSFLIAVFLFCLGAVLTFASATQAVLEHFTKGLPDVRTLSYYQPAQTTRIYASDGTLIGTLFKQNRIWTPLKDISPNLIHALLATEDSRFYEHIGVDPVGVLRAAYVDFLTGGHTEGASTITMQLANNLFLTRRPTISRKLKEMLLAMKIEKTYTKNEILEMYLNQVYFGAGAYGVDAASELYFDKKPKDLTPAEAAVIAGLPQAPSQYSPLFNPEAAHRRQLEVLHRMLTMKYLTHRQYLQAVRQAGHMKFKSRARHRFELLRVPYFTTYVIRQLSNRYSENLLYRGGLKVYTTVDMKLQHKARELVKKLVAANRRRLNVHTGALVCVQNGTGYVRAMVGGTGWSQKNQFNRAWQARRQCGSAFKTFLYTAAIESGMTPNTIVPDTPVTFGKWTPHNDDGKFMGNIPLKVGLALSRNVVAAKLIHLIGPQRVIDYAHAMGIKEHLEPYLSLALGTCDVSPFEMADAVSTIPNLGIRIPATSIKIIYDRNGNIVEDHRFPKKKEVLAESTADIMMKMMRLVVLSGTGTNAYIPHKETAGKTGTTDDFRDAWFVGYSRRYTTAVWVGNDDFSKMWESFGGDLPATIWREFMTYALRNVKSSKLPITKYHKVACLLCSITHERAGPNCPHVIRRLFPPGHLPTQFCTLHHAPVLPGSQPPKKPSKNKKKKGSKNGSPQVPVNFNNPSDIPTPTEIQLPNEVPMTAPGQPKGATTGSQSQPATGVPEVPAEPVQLPPPPKPVPVVVPLTPPPASAKPAQPSRAVPGRPAAPPPTAHPVVTPTPPE